eukprot:339706-Prorocentrum_lima.AAC.1
MQGTSQGGGQNPNTGPIQVGPASGRHIGLDQNEQRPDNGCTSHFGTKQSCSICQDKIQHHSKSKPG